MITLTITAETADDFRNQFSGFSDLVSGGTVLNTGTPAPIEKSATRTRKLADTTATVATNTKPDAQPEDDTDSDEPVTLEQLRAKAAEKAQAGKQAEVKAILATHGEGAVSKVPEDKRSLVFKALDVL